MKGIIGCDPLDTEDISKLAKYNGNFGIILESKFPNQFFDELWMDNSTNKNIKDYQYSNFFSWLKENGNLYIPYETENQGYFLREKPIVNGFMSAICKDYTFRPHFNRQEIIQHNIDFLTGIFDEKYLFLVEFIEKKYPIIGFQGNSDYQVIGYYVCTKIRYA